MNCLVWNCRGLGNPETVRSLKWQLRHKRPSLVFLMETKMLFSEVEFLIRDLEFDSFFSVDTDMSNGGRRGGLTLLWKAEHSVNVLSSSSHHINAEIDKENVQLGWRFCGNHGWHENQQKELTWELLRSLSSQGSGKWVCAGDFNEILYNFEKSGGPPREMGKMEAFHSAMADCGLEDLGFDGYKFTWSNMQEGDRVVLERLDRFLASTEWITTFPQGRVEHLMRVASDHHPILLSTVVENSRRGRKKKIFRLEEMWFRDETCMETCLEAWQVATGSPSPSSLSRKIRSCRESLQIWEATHFGNITKQLHECRTEWEKLQSERGENINPETQRHLEEQMSDLLSKEELMWKQRSRALWLKEGDKNTAYFHRTAKGRQKRNRIDKLIKEDGTVVSEDSDIDVALREYFMELFKHREDIEMNGALDAVDLVITPDHNELLDAPYTREEIERSLAQMHPLKAPGPDGMPALFYKKTWSFSQFDLCDSILNVLNNGADPSCLNETFICLIPKKKKPTSAKYFRPISLCNVIFKLITKTITNRLKLVLPDVISETQSAFVPGRLITDNALLAFEIFHFLKGNKAKKGNFAFKLDMAKVYDRVEWCFLEGVMAKLGFSVNFVSLIMRCITTVSFAVLVNGNPGRRFSPGRGLRQGDPLSPFLFLFCAEALSALIRRAESQNLIHGARICRGAPPISHLFFADDSIIFGRANNKEIQCVKNILQIYEKASGQMVNLDKSEICFSAGMGDDQAIFLSNQLGARHVQKHGTYLGMPCIVGRSKKEIFQLLEDRLRKKLKDWKKRFLSTAGRMVMIKSVAQAIPTYLMGLFLLPEQTCRRFNSLAASFLWGQKNDERRIHWCSWRAMCQTKKCGGLGFRDLTQFNRAMLAKQAWRILHDGGSLLGRTLKARYFPRGSFIDAKIAYNPPFTWRSILAGKDIIKQGTIWRIGNGRDINVWSDCWIPSLPGGRIFRDTGVVDQNMTVDNLIMEDGVRWNFDLISEYFPSAVRDQILAIPLARHRGTDMLIWKHTKNGVYSVRSGYQVACQMRDLQCDEASSSFADSPVWKWLHALKVPPKIIFFLWKCIRGLVPVSTELRKKQVNCDAMCQRCGDHAETIEHVLRDCQWSNFFWNISPLRLHFSIEDRRKSVREWIEQIASIKNSDVHHMFAIFMWNIWKSRNSLLFENKSTSHEVLLRESLKLVGELNSSPSPSETIAVIDVNWKKPPEGFWKINVDAAMGDGGDIGLGIVIRDMSGKVITSRCKKLQSNVSIEAAEGLACYEGIALARETGGVKIILETDCRQIQQKLTTSQVDLTNTGDIIRSIHVEANFFDKTIFSWARRTANKIAHLLAFLAISNDSFYDFTGCLPDCILSGIPRPEQIDFE